MTTSIVNGIRDYFSECPIIQNMSGKVKVDFLKDQNRIFSIEPIPSSPIVEEYLDGVKEKQYLFSLVVKFPYSDEALPNINNNELFENLSKWVEQQNEEGSLPELPEGCQAEELTVTSPGALLQVTADWKTGRYQMGMRLVYIETIQKGE